jgi:hypothetical protein
MPDRWTFRSYVFPDRSEEFPEGDDEVARWRRSQGPQVQGKFDRRLHDLQQMAPHEWREPFTKQLEGACDGLVEIRFKADRVQHRPLGFYGPGRLEFTMVFCAIEQGDRFVPSDACAIALRRKDEIIRRVRVSRVVDVV